MKVSEITITDVAEYVRCDTTDSMLVPILAAAKIFVSDYTGIAATSEDETAETLDSHEAFYIVVMVLCQDMYDNRTLYVDKTNMNKVVETILGMHSVNLL